MSRTGLYAMRHGDLARPLLIIVSMLTRIAQARVLMVGAGGIGCELLKNLVLTGFGEIHIVDLDTIDLSNLNRQFLFRHEHIKKSKALVRRSAQNGVWLDTNQRAGGQGGSRTV